jgi:hypothetical protein
MTNEEEKKVLKLANTQHEQLINLLTQILIEIKQNK